MKKFTLLKTLLAVALFCVGQNVWGYTKTLTDGLEVAGYKAKAFYNFQNNTPAVLPTTGDVRYRDGGGFGLHNYGSGTRSGETTITVSATDILIIETYNTNGDAATVTINKGTQNSTLSASTGYTVYDITSAGTSVTFSANRYTGIMAAFVMEKDNTAETADYTINYKASGETVKTVSGNEAVGTVIPVLSSFWVSTTKYVKDGGEPSSLTVAKGGSNLDVAVSEAPTYSYTVNATDGTNVLRVLASGSTYSGETVNVPFPRYFNVSGTLYQKNAVSSEYRQNVVITSDKQEENFVYSATGITNVVYYSEGEEISGATSTDAGNNMKIRSSNARCGYAESDLALTTLPAGKYTAKMVVYSNSSGGATLNFNYDGAYDAVVSGANNWAEKTYEFMLADSKEVKWLTSGTNKDGLDLIYIQRTGDAVVPATITSSTGYATFSSTYALDFTGVTGLTAYKATACNGTSVTLEPVTGTVAANTGLIIRGTTTNIPVVATSDEQTGNLLVACASATNITTSGTGTNYVLSVQDGVPVFAPVNGVNATVPAGHAFLYVPTAGSSRTLSIVFADESTGIKNLTPALSEGEEAIYNLRGQRVAAPAKGLYIVNGKKVVVK